MSDRYPLSSATRPTMGTHVPSFPATTSRDGYRTHINPIMTAQTRGWIPLSDISALNDSLQPNTNLIPLGAARRNIAPTILSRADTAPAKVASARPMSGTFPGPLGGSNVLQQIGGNFADDLANTGEVARVDVVQPLAVETAPTVASGTGREATQSPDIPLAALEPEGGRRAETAEVDMDIDSDSEDGIEFIGMIERNADRVTGSALQKGKGRAVDRMMLVKEEAMTNGAAGEGSLTSSGDTMGQIAIAQAGGGGQAEISMERTIQMWTYAGGEHPDPTMARVVQILSHPAKRILSGDAQCPRCIAGKNARVNDIGMPILPCIVSPDHAACAPCRRDHLSCGRKRDVSTSRATGKSRAVPVQGKQKTVPYSTIRRQLQGRPPNILDIKFFDLMLANRDAEEVNHSRWRESHLVEKNIRKIVSILTGDARCTRCIRHKHQVCAQLGPNRMCMACYMYRPAQGCSSTKAKRIKAKAPEKRQEASVLQIEEDEAEYTDADGGAESDETLTDLNEDESETGDTSITEDMDEVVAGDAVVTEQPLSAMVEDGGTRGAGGDRPMEIDEVEAERRRSVTAVSEAVTSATAGVHPVPGRIVLIKVEGTRHEVGPRTVTTSSQYSTPSPITSISTTQPPSGEILQRSAASRQERATVIATSTPLSGSGSSEAQADLLRVMQQDCEGLAGILDIPAVQKALQKINRFSMLSGTLKEGILPGLQKLADCITSSTSADAAGLLDALSEAMETVCVILNNQLLREELERRWMREDTEATFTKLFERFEALKRMMEVAS